MRVSRSKMTKKRNRVREYPRCRKEINWHIEHGMSLENIVNKKDGFCARLEGDSKWMYGASRKIFSCMFSSKCPQAEKMMKENNEESDKES